MKDETASATQEKAAQVCYRIPCHDPQCHTHGANQPVLNTDKELWRERPDDYYSDRIFVTIGGGIGIDVGGKCIVLPLKLWHAAGKELMETANEHIKGAKHTHFNCVLCGEIMCRQPETKP